MRNPILSSTVVSVLRATVMRRPGLRQLPALRLVFLLSILKLRPSVMSLRHTILGFLSIQPMSGYDLKRYFEASVRHFWTADQAAIYRALAELTSEQLVEHERVTQTTRPDRKVYRLTGDGLTALDTWLAIPALPVPRREPLLVKLFFASRLSAEALRGVLEAELSDVDARLEGFRQIVESIRANPGTSDESKLVGPLVTLTNGVRAGLAEREWLRGLLEMQREGTLTAATLLADLEARLGAS